MAEYINGTTDILGGSVIRHTLNTTTPNQAVIRKIIAGNGISISSTGVDPGTGDVTISIDTSGTGGSTSGGSGGSGNSGTPTAVGTVTAVNMTAPEGMFVIGAPITTAGTISLRLSSGYVIPLYDDVQQGKTAYSWGNHANYGYVTGNIYTTNGTLTSSRSILSGGFTLTINPITTFSGSVTASASLGIGHKFTPTISASANNDILVGLDILPTFTANGFTPIYTYGTRTKSLWINHTSWNSANTTPALHIGDTASTIFQIQPGASNSTTLFLRGNNPLLFNWYLQIIADYNATIQTGPYVENMYFKMGSTTAMTIKSSGNVIIGTGVTDTTYKVDVQGNISAKMPSYASTGFRLLNSDLTVDWQFTSNGNNSTNGRPFLLVPRWGAGTPIQIGNIEQLGNNANYAIMIGGGISNGSYLSNKSIRIGYNSNATIGVGSIVIGTGNAQGNYSISLSSEQYGVPRGNVPNNNSFVIGSTHESTTTNNNQGILNATEVYIGRPARSLSFTGDTYQGTATSINGNGGYGFTDATGGDLRINGGIGLGSGTPGDVIIGTATPTTTGTTLQTLIDRVWIKGGGTNVGIGASPNVINSLEISKSNQWSGAFIGNMGGVRIPSVAYGIHLGWNYATSGDANILWGTGEGLYPYLTFSSWDGTNKVDRMVLSDSGKLTLKQYLTTASFTGTPVGYIAFDSTGGLITVPVPSNVVSSMRFTPTTTPVSPSAGDVYYDSSTNKLRCYNGTTWNDLF
jgi:hypothetical protein